MAQQTRDDRGRFAGARRMSTWISGREVLDENEPLEGERRAAVAAQVARSVGLSRVWADRLRGGTARELRQDAEDVVGLVGTSGSRMSRWLRGRR
jgi:hypothetical protein